MTKEKLVKITAIPGFDIDEKEDGHMTLWGVLFTASKGKLTAELPESEAKAMIKAKRVK